MSEEQREATLKASTARNEANDNLQRHLATMSAALLGFSVAFQRDPGAQSAAENALLYCAWGSLTLATIGTTASLAGRVRVRQRILNLTVAGASVAARISAPWYLRAPAKLALPAFLLGLLLAVAFAVRTHGSSANIRHQTEQYWPRAEPEAPSPISGIGDGPMRWLPIGISLASLIVAALSWREANRPAVTVRVITAGAGDLGMAFNLNVRNCGNRPAHGVRLSCHPEALQAALSPALAGPPDEIAAVFAPTTRITVLGPGEEARCGFGTVFPDPKKSTWRHWSELPVVITYHDVHGREFRENGELILTTDHSFTSYIWRKAKSGDSAA